MKNFATRRATNVKLCDTPCNWHFMLLCCSNNCNWTGVTFPIYSNLPFKNWITRQAMYV